MPPVDYWETLFDVPLIVGRMGLEGAGSVVEVGTGYGTFTIPAARMSGALHSYEIDLDAANYARKRLSDLGIANASVEVRDILADGTGMADESVDYIMLFNILHHESPEDFLQEALRILRPGGRAGVIHWRYDSTTPRGPAMEIRPRPDQLKKAMGNAGFAVSPEESPLDLPPYHYGWIGTKPGNSGTSRAL